MARPDPRPGWKGYNCRVWLKRRSPSSITCHSSMCKLVIFLSVALIAVQGLGKTVTCMALILKTLGQAAAAPPGAAVHYTRGTRGRRAGYYEIHETGRTAAGPNVC